VCCAIIQFFVVGMTQTDTGRCPLWKRTGRRNCSRGSSTSRRARPAWRTTRARPGQSAPPMPAVNTKASSPPSTGCIRASGISSSRKRNCAIAGTACGSWLSCIPSCRLIPDRAEQSAALVKHLLERRVVKQLAAQQIKQRPGGHIARAASPSAIRDRRRAHGGFSTLRPSSMAAHAGAAAEMRQRSPAAPAAPNFRQLPTYVVIGNAVVAPMAHPSIAHVLGQCVNFAPPPALFDETSYRNRRLGADLGRLGKRPRAPRTLKIWCDGSITPATE